MEEGLLAIILPGINAVMEMNETLKQTLQSHSILAEKVCLRMNLKCNSKLKQPCTKCHVNIRVQYVQFSHHESYSGQLG